MTAVFPEHQCFDSSEIYSIVTYGAALKTVDFIVEGLDRSKAAMIITEMPDEISDALIE